MTVYVTNYQAGQPRVSVRIDTDVAAAASWHKQLSPKNLGPVEVLPGVVCATLHLALVRYRSAIQGRACSMYDYRFSILGGLYMELVVQTDAFTKLCEIYDRDGVLVLRDRDASPWLPASGTWDSVFRRPDFTITHSHVLAAMLMADPVTDHFKRMRHV